MGLAAKSGQPVVTASAPEHPNYKYFPETGEERFQSLMAVPMIVRGVTIGVLAVQTIDPRDFESDDVETFQTCAQLIAPVVINARLLALVGISDEDSARVNAELAMAGVPSPGSGQDRAPEENIEFRGIAISRGVAIGSIYRLENPLDLQHLDYTPSSDPAQEVRDLMEAIGEARRELDGVRDELGSKFGLDLAAVFQTHIQILEDKGFVEKLRDEAMVTGNALDALKNVLAAYRQTFERIADPYFRERAVDVEDVGQRVMERLIGERHHAMPLMDGAIVVASHIMPGLFARLDVDKIAAIVSEHGGSTSHGAIFARTLEIPAVTGLSNILDAVRPGEPAVVDGDDGILYLSPDEGLVAEFQRAQQKYAIAIEHLDALRQRPAETLDGRRVRLTANVGLARDLRLVERHGADGVGLFRTEVLALAQRALPDEAEQSELYGRVAKALSPRPLTIRTFDLGGDKELPNVGVADEENPQLGCRSIRLSLRSPRAFRSQVRAILRASRFGNVRMMLPMISSVEEFRQARALIDHTRDEMVRSGIEVDLEMPVGVMIEVPAAAIRADALARECDFFSIGTNDLTQYTLAVDRGNEHVAEIYDPLHPAVLALIEMSVSAAARARIPVSVCGEMASDPLAVPLLVGLGIRELSGTPSAVPVVKEIIRALEYGSLERDVRLALDGGSATDVRKIGIASLQNAGLLEHPDIGPWLQSAIDRLGRSD